LSSASDPAASPVRVEPTPRALLLCVLTVAASWVTLQLLPVLLVVVAALLLVGTLNPAVECLETKGLARERGIALVFAAMFIPSWPSRFRRSSSKSMGSSSEGATRRSTRDRRHPSDGRQEVPNGFAKYLAADSGLPHQGIEQQR
jgi:hypothetical protein